MEGEAGRLLTALEALQVQSLTDPAQHHIVVPFVFAGEPRSAVITVSRRGKSKKVDKRNASLRIRTCLSVLGEVEVRVQIRNNVLWILFLLENGRHLQLFDKHWDELSEALVKLGYAVGRLKADLLTLKNLEDAGSGDGFKGEGRSGFDVTV